MTLGDFGLGLRELLLALVLILCAYLAYSLLRMRRLQREEAMRAAARAGSPASTTISTTDEGPYLAPGAAHLDPEPAREQQLSRRDWYEPPEPPKPFPGEARVANLERLLSRTQEEVARQRDILAGLNEEVARLREDLGEQVAQVQAAQHISPIYGDAMQMAASGYDALQIADRCGIARAEAELVAALVRNRESPPGREHE